MHYNGRGIPETVRITQSDYDRMVEAAREVEKEVKRNEKEGRIMFDPMMFPLPEELDEYDVRHEMRKFLPYLVYFKEKDICGLKSPELDETRRRIEELFEKYVVIMDDEDCEEIRNMTPERWKEMSDAERSEVLEPIILYYRPNEFETFLKDLGWLPCMRYARYSEKNYREGKTSKRLEKDLLSIWEIVFPPQKEEQEK
jgi:hypothetical protein